MSDYLPQEVLIDILSRLPVKSLLRFRCVSKSWCSLITSPNFITTHLNQSNNNNAPQLLIKYFSVNPKKEHYSVRLDSETLDHYAEFKCPFKSRSENFFRVVGFCNGLICLSDDHFGYTYTIIIWNPAIRRCVTLPMPRVCFDVYGPYMFALGFGVDPRTNDYKVVRLAYLANKMGSWDTSLGVEPLLRRSKDGYLAPPVVEVFALSTGSWKTIDAGIPPCKMIEHFWSSAFVNGTIHWLAYYRMEALNQSFCNTIMLFDVGAEVFHEMNLPKRLAREFPAKLEIGVFGETLSVFRYDDRALSECCSVWVMKQYGVAESWSKLFNVNLREKLVAALGFRKNGEILLAKLGVDVVSYNPSDKCIKSLGIRGSRDSVYVGTFTERLVLLDEVNGVHVESCDTVDSEEEPVLGGQDEEAVVYELEKNSLLHHLFAAHDLNRY